MSCIVEVKDLCYTYMGQEVLHHINFCLKQGDFTAIIGPNGGGKTTLLKLITGLLQPTRGMVNIASNNEGKTSIGYVPQSINHNMHFPTTALDVVLMGNHTARKPFHFFPSKAEKQNAYETLSRIGMQGYAETKIEKLSGGQRQRVLIARALIANPQLLVLDEPTASIDTEGQAEFYNLLTELNKELSILLVSHDLLMVAKHAKSLACLNKHLTYYPSFRSFPEVMDKFYACSHPESLGQEGISTSKESANA